MALIDLNLAFTYCPEWKSWEGIRELVQNAVDGDEEGYAMSLEHSPKTGVLRITNRGISLPESALVMGYSFKGSQARGKHGEGLKVGLLALTRAGHDVTIYNGGESWRPEVIERGSVRVLGVRTRALGNRRTDLTVEVHGMPTELWDVYSKLFLFVRKPSEKTILRVGDDQLLLAPEYAGHVFCRGIFVCCVRNLKCGYELPSLTLDRDRGMIESWDLRYRLGVLWEEACAKHPDRAVPILYDAMSLGPSEELRVSEGRDMKVVGRELRAEMKRRRGDKAVAVASASMADRLRTAGLEPVSLPQAMVDLMAQDGQSAEFVELAHRESIVEYVDEGSLENTEMDVLCALSKLVGRRLFVVRFTDPTVGARRDGTEVVVDRSLLGRSMRQAAPRVVLAECSLSGRLASDIYLEALFPDVHDATAHDPPDGTVRRGEPSGVAPGVRDQDASRYGLLIGMGHGDNDT